MDTEEILMESSSPPAYTEQPDSQLTAQQDQKESTTAMEKDQQLSLKSPESSVLRLSQRKPMNEAGDNLLTDTDEDIEDETLLERLIGLSEMFPESVRNSASSLFSVTFTGLKSLYSMSRNVSWFLASTASLCFLPLFLELERVQTEEQEAVHQRTMMLGPKAAATGSPLAGFSSVPHLTPM